MEIGPQKLTILGDSGIFREYSLLFWANPILSQNLSYFYTISALRSPLTAHHLAYKSRPC